MASVGSTSAISSVTISSQDTQVEIVNQTLNISGNEYSKTLPLNCKKFFVKARTNCELRLAYATGETNVSYITIKYGAVYTDDNFYSGKVIYLQSNANNSIVEIASFY
jgi:hypothetical protein